MSEHTGNTQPVPFEPGSTQPLKPVKKKMRWGSLALSVVGILALLLLGGVGGYWNGIGTRKTAEATVLTKQLAEQYQLALVDEQFGRFEAAKERLEFIIQNGPTFPGAQNELAKVLVQMTVPTVTPTPTITPTPDVRGEQGLFATANQFIATGDWPGALAQLDQLRKQDPKYKTAEIDGMYYFALRNYGMDLIQKQGNLEGGIYQLTLAERFAPLDNSATSLRDGARLYLTASSFFGVDWKQSVYFFAQAATAYPSLWDGTMSSTQRYQVSLMRYGDQLWKAGDACGAVEQYTAAQGLGNLDDASTKNANQAYQECYPATDVPTAATVEPTGAVPTNTGVVPPTATTEPPTAEPTQAPSETPTP